ncbi:MAG: DUF2339 domain-containing protein [Bacteroidota bacterium]
MEIFLLIILMALAVLIINRIGDNKQLVKNGIADLRKEVQQLRAELKNFQAQASATTTAKSKPETPTVEDAKPAEAPETKYRWNKPESIVPEEAPLPTLREELLPPVLEPLTSPVPAEESPIQPPVPELQEVYAAAATTRPPAPERSRTRPPVPVDAGSSFWEKFLQNNPDMEKFIGENLINKIGIAILVLGIGYFVKFAIDQDWINEIGRVGIGILAGGILIGLAHRLRNSFSAFSSVLVGGGLSVLYFTIAIAFHQYHIFTQTAAFIIMVVITGFSIVLALSYNRVELAVVSLIGGFATPFMVSTGQGNYQVLFTYVLILNVGMLALTYFKKWNIVHLIAYGFTVLLYGGWLSTKVIGQPNAPYIGALVFGTLFYLVFFAMNILYNIKEKAKFSALEISLLLSNTAFYYAAGMLILANINHGAYQGIFTVAVAVLNCAFAINLYKRETVDRNLIYLLIGLVITFVSLAVPVQLEGNHITMFWALEAVLLLWFSQKSGLTLVAKGSVVVTGLMLVSLLMDWGNVYNNNALDNPLAVLLNKGFITSFISVVSLLVSLQLLRKQEQPFNFWLGKLEVSTYRQIVSYVAGISIYLAFALELNYQLITYIGFSPSRTIVMGSYNLLFLVGLLVLAKRQGLLTISIGAVVLSIVGIFGYIFFFNPATMQLLREHFLSGEPTFVGFPFHYVSVALVIIILVFINQTKALLSLFIPRTNQIWTWFLCLVVVWVASSELFFHVIYFNFSFADAATFLRNPAQQLAADLRFDYVITQTNKVGLPILWGICAFVFMWLGLNQKNKNLRILSLSLFTLTLIKLFAYDIRGISEGGKIAAFISLSVILLIISFMYQKIRKQILDES